MCTEKHRITKEVPMLNYSFSTVLMAVLSSNILLILITIFFQNSKVMVNIGYKLLALFIALTALRFLLPFELPFTKSIILTDFEFISLIISRIRRPFYTIDSYEVSLWTLFEIVWLVGCLINIIKYIREHMKARYFVLANSLDVTTREPYASMLTQICSERNQKNRFQILSTSGITKPMLYGVFSPRILIPENMELSREDLYYSLAHEAAHHFHHDLFIKKMLRLITIVYWWNPVCYLLTNKADSILEMRVDDKITALGVETLTSYLHCLVNIGEQAVHAEENGLSKSVTMSLLSEKDGELVQRYYMMTSTGQKKNYFLNIGSFALVLIIYATSHMYIFEAHYANPDTESISIGQTQENSYAILKDDGTYDIYYKEYFIENVETLEFYDSSIPIYTEKEFTNEEH